MKPILTNTFIVRNQLLPNRIGLDIHNPQSHIPPNLPPKPEPKS